VTLSEASRLLERYKAGEVRQDEVLRAFQAAPVEDLGFAVVDAHRGLRNGFPEVIFGSGKTPAQVVKIAQAIVKREGQLLITRVTAEQGKLLKKAFKRGVFHELARCFVVKKQTAMLRKGSIAIVSAGTSDMPVAEEAAVTAEVMGNSVMRVYDVGVAGLHRLLARVADLRTANVIVVVAGMEGALPSVVAGLVSRPVIAVPTSIGYGANFGGLAALLGMLTSCGSGVTVVNIDNGFGAGYAASQINALADSAK
jgi:NCAIR mutase (PurE)-related protein